MDGQLAWDCLSSVPLNVDDAIRLVQSIQPFLVWQSSALEISALYFEGDGGTDGVDKIAAAYLRDPPSDYQFPGMCSPVNERK